MKELTLRDMIRGQIKKQIHEAPQVSRIQTSLGRIEKMAGVKMLKKALGRGTPNTQAAGLHSVVKAISGDNPATAKSLARLLMKQGIDTPGEVDPTPDVQEANKQLGSRLGKLDKTQPMKMMRKTLKNKPASVQAEFVADLVKGLELKGNITMLIKKIRQAN